MQDKKQLLQQNFKQMMGIVRSAYSSILFDAEPLTDLCGVLDTEEARLHCGYQNTSQLLAVSSGEVQDVEHVYKVCLLLSDKRNPLMRKVS